MKPVAWIGKDELQFGFTDTRVTNEKESWDDIPLYTHPAKTLDRELLDKTIIDQQNEIKELRKNLDVALMIVNEPAKTLTDEEIYEIAMEVQTGFLPQDDTLAFARAILRKAQEK